LKYLSSSATGSFSRGTQLQELYWWCFWQLRAECCQNCPYWSRTEPGPPPFIRGSIEPKSDSPYTLSSWRWMYNVSETSLTPSTSTRCKGQRHEEGTNSETSVTSTRYTHPPAYQHQWTSETSETLQYPSGAMNHRAVRMSETPAIFPISTRCKDSWAETNINESPCSIYFRNVGNTVHMHIEQRAVSRINITKEP
jgi:hypothetical protein